VPRRLGLVRFVGGSSPSTPNATVPVASEGLRGESVGSLARRLDACGLPTGMVFGGCLLDMGKEGGVLGSAG
jgi:hypothetical protein